MNTVSTIFFDFAIDKLNSVEISFAIPSDSIVFCVFLSSFDVDSVGAAVVFAVVLAPRSPRLSCSK